MEFNTGVPAVTPTPTENCRERGKMPNSEPELGSEQEPESKPKPRGSIWDEWYDEDPDLNELSIYDDDDEPYIYMCEKYVYKNKLRLKLEAADNEHLERSRGLSVCMRLSLSISFFVFNFDSFWTTQYNIGVRCSPPSARNTVMWRCPTPPHNR